MTFPCDPLQPLHVHCTIRKQNIIRKCVIEEFTRLYNHIFPFLRLKKIPEFPVTCEKKLGKEGEGFFLIFFYICIPEYDLGIYLYFLYI